MTDTNKTRRDVNPEDLWPGPGSKKPLSPKSPIPGAERLGEFIFAGMDRDQLFAIDKDNYGVFTDDLNQATSFTKYKYGGKCYWAAASGIYQGWYLSYSHRGYLGTYGWNNAVAWTESGVLGVDGEDWETYRYEERWVVIGNYDGYGYPKIPLIITPIP